jgi:RsiW-degrading membrane proteinase PrsW (M82 family)
MMESSLRILVSILPVVAFLISLIFLDSYKLVKLRSVIFTALIGFMIALVCYIINNALQELLQIKHFYYIRYVSPFVEETFKAIYIVFLLKTRRIGFMVDAAIYGFAVGAGFAIIENVYYLQTHSDSGMYVWLVRGFGTAVMHGSATSIFAVISQRLAEQRKSEKFGHLLPGLGIAILLHSLFNHFIISPELSTVWFTIGVPLLMIIIFQHSEKSTQEWLGVGFDSDADLLEMITTGNISQARLGKYLLSLKGRFPGEVVADMLCLLRIHLELSIRAKGILLMRESGFSTPHDPRLQEKFDELRYLEKSVGRTGRLAIMPFLRWSSRELWQLHMLGKKRGKDFFAGRKTT